MRRVGLSETNDFKERKSLEGNFWFHASVVDEVEEAPVEHFACQPASGLLFLDVPSDLTFS
jgi:hypothetical protein